MDFRILGPLEVVDRGVPLSMGGRRQRTVLAVLLVNANSIVSTDRLVDEVWGDHPPETARRSLQAYVSRLRGLLGGDGITAVEPGYRLRLDPADADWERFEQSVTKARALMDTDSARAAALLRDALAMWRGSPFADLSDERSLQPAIARLEAQRLAAVEEWIEAELATGRHGPLVGEIESLVGRYPLRERLRGQLMLALYRSGRQSEALRSYQEARHYLVEELGVEPSPELQWLEERMLAQDPALGIDVAIPRQSVESGANPYKGLQAFGEGDAGDFHGREQLVKHLVERIESERFLGVIGASGCGKSSVVRAGLVPALRAGSITGSHEWCIATMVPGPHPFEELEAALLHACGGSLESLSEQFRGDNLDLLRAILRIGPDHDVLLVIDQFEELFLLGESEDERQRFIRNLSEALEDPHSRLRIVVTLRADFYDLPLSYPEPAGWIGGHQVTVPPLTPAELERAAVLPATHAGVEFELDLAAELVADVAGNPGALPLFQYTLTELYERRGSRALTLDAYREFGGLSGALKARAEQLFDSLTDEEQTIARQVFLRLVTLGDGSDDTRRRVAVGDLADLDRGTGDRLAAVLERFGAHRLLSFDRNPATGESTLELAHEALLSGWPRLAAWVDASREGLRLHRGLSAGATEWQIADRHPDYLLAGARLSLFREWRAETDLRLTQLEQEYLDAGIARQEGELAFEAARRDREALLERRSVSRLRRLVAGLAIAVIVAAGLTTYAVNRARDADRSAAEANLYAARVSAAELTASSVANLTRDGQLSLLLALHAVNIMHILDEPVPRDTVAAVHWAVQASHIAYPGDLVRVATADGPNGPRGLFEMPVDDLVAVALTGVARDLTEQECAQFIRTGECDPLPTELAGLRMHGEFDPPLDAERPLAGTRILMVGAFTGAEAEGYRAELKRFKDLTGISVFYLGLDDFESRVEDLVALALAPSIVLAPQPGYVRDLAQKGLVIDLSGYLDSVALSDAYSPYLIDLMTANDPQTGATDLLGVPFRLNVKSAIWYPVPEFEEAGFGAPATWEQLLAMSDDMVARGMTPWCWGEEADVADGWPATDWIEDLVLHEFGVDVYDRWVASDLPFQSDEIRSAFERLGQIVFHDGYLAGGLPRALSAPYWLAQEPMFGDPPKCWLYHQASFATVWMPKGVVGGLDTLTFPFPAVGAGSSAPLLGGGEFAAAAVDLPEVRELMRYLTRPDFGIEWVRAGVGFLSANRSFDATVYDELSKGFAAQISAALETDTLRFDGSDLMERNGSWFWTGMMDYLEQGPDSLDEVLTNLDDPEWRENNGL